MLWAFCFATKYKAVAHYANSVPLFCLSFTASHDRNISEQRFPLWNLLQKHEFPISVWPTVQTIPASSGNMGTIQQMPIPAGSLQNGWLGREGSNLRMPESKSGALPLGDAPTFLHRRAAHSSKMLRGRSIPDKFPGAIALRNERNIAFLQRLARSVTTLRRH
jgi:hypothetical protein